MADVVARVGEDWMRARVSVLTWVIRRLIELLAWEGIGIVERRRTVQ
jgi:hypothetical protein